MNNADMPAMPIGEQMDGIHMNPNCNGLTKREYLAAMAMQGIASARALPLDTDYVAVAAVSMADALLKELNK